MPLGGSDSPDSNAALLAVSFYLVTSSAAAECVPPRTMKTRSRMNVKARFFIWLTVDLLLSYDKYVILAVALKKLSIKKVQNITCAVPSVYWLEQLTT